MLFLENMMFSFKKKMEFTPREDLMNALNAELLKTEDVSQYFLQADANIVRNTQEFNKINEVRRHFHEEIGKTKHGKQWFKIVFAQYLKRLTTLLAFDTEMIRLDAYLSLYWYLCTQYPVSMEPMIEMCKESMDPRLRRYYEKTYNIDIFTGRIFDMEVEKNNAWKEHFYKASFAFHEGKGNLEISIQEWRTFIKEFMDHLSNRPRLIYDFAKEIVAYQKLFHFFSYVVRIEKLNQKHDRIAEEHSYIDILLVKMINAVYAVDEEHGMILKKLYV